MQSEHDAHPAYKVRPKETVMVPMRDGIRLAVDIFRPEGEGKFPALLAMSGYGKDLQSTPQIPQPHFGSLLWDGCIEAGNTKQI